MTAKRSQGTRTAKRKTASTTVEEYLSKIPKPSRATFLALRKAVRSAAPREAVEVISYGIPALKQDRILVWYAAFSNHCSLFPTNSVIEEFEEELEAFKTSKGTIQFPVDRRLPTTLIKKIVKARVASLQKNSRR